MKHHPILRIEEKSPEIYEVSDLFLGDLSQLRLWLFDLEATGLDTSKERVTQIAGIPIERGQIVDAEAFVQLVNPGDGVQIPAVVQELTGIKPEMLRDAPSFAEAWPMCERAAGAADVWIGQSVFEFDVPLLQAELARHAMPPDLPPILDSVVMATHLLGPPENRWSTSALIEKFSVDITGLRRHDALDDVKILGRILLPMLARFTEEHADTLYIAPTRPLAIKRHPPVKS
jgi:DNA polymerase III epsilon subunit-like protein